MWAGIIALVGPVAMRIVGNWLDKRGASQELKAKFEDFRAAMVSNGFLRAEIRDDVERQRTELEEQSKK